MNEQRLAELEVAYPLNLPVPEYSNGPIGPAVVIHELIAEIRRTEMQYLGCLGLLARCSLGLVNAEDSAEELRGCIEDALGDAQKIGLPIRWRRILSRIEVEVK